ncbi:MAG: ATP-binding cassette domain-containing protein [Desulfobacteraceae bacterium]|jgi:ABC-2 type transport system ATP-binding protein
MINAEGLTKFYGTQCAVDHIDLDIRKGEIVGLLGPNGAGKTTTLRMLTGYLRPSSGNIRIKDFNISDNPLEIKKIMGYLPESAPLYNEMLAYDYLYYVAEIRNIEKDRIDSRLKKVADLCGINEAMHKPISVLSKGYKQRVGLAHAMMDDPEILILDEPTSGLDPNQIVEIRDIIREIGKEKTVILSTHILSEAEATCDRIIIINRGKIAADQSIDELKDSMSKEFLVNISLKYASPDDVRDEFSPVEGVEEIAESGDDAGVIKITLRCGSDNDPREEIYKRIKQHDWVLLEFHHEIQTLERVFRDITREN